MVPVSHLLAYSTIEALLFVIALFLVPVEITRLIALGRRRANGEYQGAPRLVGAVAAGVVQGPGAVHRRCAGVQRTGDGQRCVHAVGVDFQGDDLRVVLPRMVWPDFTTMAPGDELHTAHFLSRLLKGEPDGQLLIELVLFPVGLVLMPGRRARGVRGFDDHVVAYDKVPGRVRAHVEELRRDIQRSLPGRRLRQIGDVMRRVQQLRYGAIIQLGIGVFTGQVEIQGFAAIGRRGEQPIERVTLTRDFSVAKYGRQDDEALLAVRNFLFVRELHRDHITKLGHDGELARSCSGYQASLPGDPAPDRIDPGGVDHFQG